MVLIGTNRKASATVWARAVQHPQVVEIDLQDPGAGGIDQRNSPHDQEAGGGDALASACIHVSWRNLMNGMNKMMPSPPRRQHQSGQGRGVADHLLGELRDQHGAGVEHEPIKRLATTRPRNFGP